MKRIVSISCILTMAGILMLTGMDRAEAQSLWVGDSLSGPSKIFELNAQTGAVLSSIPGPGTYVDALSFSNDGQSIFVLDSSVNSNVYQIGLNGAVLNSFFVPLDAEGLTILGDGSLVIGGGGSNTIAFVNSTNGTILYQFTPIDEVYGIASNGLDTIFGLTIDGRIDSYSLAGAFLGSLETNIAGTTLGLAFTGDSFFVAVTGSMIYEIDLAGGLLNSFAGPGPFSEGLDYPEGVQVPVVPIPAAVWLLGSGLLGLLGLRRKFFN